MKAAVLNLWGSADPVMPHPGQQTEPFLWVRTNQTPSFVRFCQVLTDWTEVRIRWINVNTDPAFTSGPVPSSFLPPPNPTPRGPNHVSSCP